ncbi:hypothetical protein ACNKHO_20025 [Shigella flexneri]
MKLTAQGSILDLSHPHVMGILNVTPDSSPTAERITRWLRR